MVWVISGDERAKLEAFLCVDRGRLFSATRVRAENTADANHPCAGFGDRTPDASSRAAVSNKSRLSVEFDFSRDRDDRAAFADDSRLSGRELSCIFGWSGPCFAMVADDRRIFRYASSLAGRCRLGRMDLFSERGGMP
jgi:hypothetical protein